MLLKIFYDTNKSSSLISSVISIIMLTLYQFLDSTVESMISLIKSYLIPHLLNDKAVTPTVIKKANQFISFKFGDVQFLDIVNFLGGATTLDSFLKAYQSEETKGYFPYEWFDSPPKLDCSHLPPYDSFFSKLKNLNPLEKDFAQFEKLIKSGKDESVFLREMGLKEKPRTRNRKLCSPRGVVEVGENENFSRFLSTV